MTNEEDMVDCSIHGKSVPAIVCCHLVKNNGAPLGFIENNSDPDDLQGWCYACEHLFLQELDKTEKFNKFCDFVVVCSGCYNQIKSAHEI